MKVAFLLTLSADQMRSLRETMYARLGLRRWIRHDHAETAVASGTFVDVDSGHQVESRHPQSEPSKP